MGLSLTSITSVQKNKMIKKLILEDLFADDSALIGYLESALQLLINNFAKASHLFGLTISLRKTEVLFKPNPPTTDHYPLREYS